MTEAKGWTLSRLGTEVGVGRSEVSRVVGGAEVKDSTLEKYALALGVSVYYLKYGKANREATDFLWEAAKQAGRNETIDSALAVMRSAMAVLEGMRDNRVERRLITDEEALDAAVKLPIAELTDITTAARRVSERAGIVVPIGKRSAKKRR